MWLSNDGNKISYRGNWGGRVWRMDCVIPATSRRARHFGGCMGTEQLPCVFGWRDANHPLHLWTESAVYKDGGTCRSIVGGARETLEAEAAASNRGPVDGEGWR